jgi:hypothetical protein
MVTDFRNIRAGSLHRANGGFLVLDAMQVEKKLAAGGVIQHQAGLLDEPVGLGVPESDVVGAAVFRLRGMPNLVRIVL